MSEVVPSHEEQEADRKKAETPQQDLYFRLLVSFAAIGSIGTRILPLDDFNFPLGFACFWLVYPLAAYFITRKNLYYLDIVTRCLAIADAFLLGMLIHIIDFGLMPFILFLTIIQCQAMITGGWKKCVEDAVAYLVGLLVPFVFYQAHFNPLGDSSGSLASLIGICVYFVIYSIFIYRQIAEVRSQSVTLHAEQQDLKLKTWNLSRHVSPQVWKMIFSGHAVKLETKRKQLTVFFSDIKGFSEASEQLDPDVLNQMLGEYLTEMSNIVHKHGGTIDKFIGDAIMVFFGDPNTKGLKQDALACVSMAIEMKRTMKDLQQKWLSEGINMPLEIRMGINTGYCTVGNFGTQQRMDYTAVGTEVNLASRLESVSPPGEILISAATYNYVKDIVMCRDTGQVKVKGFAEPVQTFQVVDFRQNVGGNQTFYEQRTDGFAIYMDLDKIKSYDKEKVLKTLLTVATKLKNKPT